MASSNEDGQFNQLVTVIGQWCEGPFAQATWMGQCRRLHQEVNELCEAYRVNVNRNQMTAFSDDQTHMAEEMADILMIVFHMAWREDINLFKACLDKWEVNRQRKWQADPQGDSVSHIRDHSPMD